MRLTTEERKLLKASIYTLDNSAKIYLFGSRVNDQKRGGDIDLLVFSNNLSRKNIRQIKDKFFRKFGEQRLDLVVPNNYNKAFIDFILEEAVEI